MKVQLLQMRSETMAAYHKIIKDDYKGKIEAVGK